MKDEIKEIERILATSGKYITYAERCYVLDYITNLQEELDRCVKANIILDDENAELQGEKQNLQEENEILKELNVCVGCNNNPDYKSRNEKAIEYIKQHSSLGGRWENDKFIVEYINEVENGMELLNILNGGDE